MRRRDAAGRAWPGPAAESLTSAAAKQAEVVCSLPRGAVSRPYGRAVERIREALEEHGCQPRGSTVRLRARCPVHESHGNLTLAVSQGRAGAVLYCHAGCVTADILAAVGCCWEDMFDEPRERPPAWVPRPRAVPATGAQMAGRVIVRALRIVMLREEMAAEPRGEPVPWQERVQRAEDGCRQDADDHYLRTMARYAALATDEAYVRKAYAAPVTGPWDKRRTPEQTAVLVARREDLERAR